MKVSDFMIKEVYSARPIQTVKEVMQLFVEKRIGGIPICDENKKLIGVVTDGDIIRSIKPIDRQLIDLMFYITVLQGHNLEKRIEETIDSPILNIAKKKNIVTVSPDDELETVVNLLSKYHFKKIPVVNDNNEVVGIVSRGDVLRIIQKEILKSLEVNSNRNQDE